MHINIEWRKCCRSYITLLIVTSFFFTFAGCTPRPSPEILAEYIPDKTLVTTSTTAKATRSIPTFTATFMPIDPGISPTSDYFDNARQENNVLYIFHDGYITLYNLSTHEQVKVTFPKYCRNGLLPFSRMIYCDYNANFYLLDPISKERIHYELGDNANFLRTSPDGKYYLIAEELDGKNSFYALNMRSKALTNLFPENNEPENISLPTISRSGEYISYIQWNESNDIEIIIKSIQNEETRTFDVEQGEVTSILSWSPDQLKFIVGVNDLETDMPGIFNYLYIIDLIENSIKLLSKAEEDNPYEFLDLLTDPDIFSPNGEYIVVPTPSGLCRIDLVEIDQLCIKIEDMQHLISLDWSANGNQIALGINTVDSTHKVYIISLNDLTLNSVDGIDAIDVDDVNWR